VLGFGEQQQPPTRGGLTQAELVAARQREPAAVTRLYTAYAPALFRFFVAEVGNRQEAQDLTGSVFLSVIEGLPGFRGPVEALGGWLFRIARNDLYDLRRKQARSPGLAPLDDHLDEAAMAAGADDPEELAIERLEGSQVMAALQQLSPDQREVLLLRMGAGLTAPEVAAALHKTTGAVKSLQHRGLARLARLLGLRSPHDSPDRPYPSLDPARLTLKEEDQER
jgi:RNA polymerase sigma-70 factor, ECF subfamily